MRSLDFAQQDTAFPVIDPGCTYPIQPHHIDVDCYPVKIYGKTDLERDAFMLIRFFFIRGCWCTFDYRELLEHGYSRPERKYPFIGTREHPLLVQLSDGSFAATHYLISSMFLACPARELAQNGATSDTTKSAP